MNNVSCIRMDQCVMLIMKENLYLEHLLKTLVERQETDHQEMVSDVDDRHYAIDDIIIALSSSNIVTIEKAAETKVNEAPKK